MNGKNIFLGVNFKREKCCVLYTDVDYNKIKDNNGEIEKTIFQYGATNWNGNDDIERTLRIEELKLTGRELLLSKPLIFSGIDYDHGNKYEWNFEVASLLEARHEKGAYHVYRCDSCLQWIDIGDNVYEVRYDGKTLKFCSNCCRCFNALKIPNM